MKLALGPAADFGLVDDWRLDIGPNMNNRDLISFMKFLATLRPLINPKHWDCVMESIDFLHNNGYIKAENKNIMQIMHGVFDDALHESFCEHRNRTTDPNPTHSYMVLHENKVML